MGAQQDSNDYVQGDRLHVHNLYPGLHVYWMRHSGQHGQYIDGKLYMEHLVHGVENQEGYIVTADVFSNVHKDGFPKYAKCVLMFLRDIVAIVEV